MSSRLLTSLALLATGLGLNAQGIFTNANTPDSPTCPRVIKEKTDLNYSSQYGRNKADASTVYYNEKGSTVFPRGERKDVSLFTAYDKDSKGTSIASLKGKVVLVGFWSKNCAPSASMLMEFANLYAKRAQYGFELLSVNFDENQQDGGSIEGGWRAINTFVIKNRQVFEASKLPLYIPGLGKEGPSNFMDMVMSLPVLFLVDREGKLAELHIGYENGYVGKVLSRGLIEKPAPAAPAPAAPAPPAPVAPKP